MVFIVNPFNIRNKLKLKRYLEFANCILVNSENTQEKLTGLLHLQKHLSLIIQTTSTDNVIKNPSKEVNNFDLFSLFLELSPTVISYNPPLKSSLNFKSPILSLPWKITSLCNCFSTIGGASYPFQENKASHSPNTLIHPLNTIHISNGRHSMLVGVLEGTGTITIDQIFDISESYHSVYFDGTYFRFKKGNKILRKAPIVEIGIMYEVGRLAMENNLIFHHFLVNQSSESDLKE